jgi:hypothetical protein
MSRFIEAWQRKSLFEKSATIITLVLSCCVIILSAISLAGLLKVDVSNNIVMPMLAIIVALNGFIQYKTNKMVAIFIWICAALMIIACIFVYGSMLLK